MVKLYAKWEEAEVDAYFDTNNKIVHLKTPKKVIICTNCRFAFDKNALYIREYCPSCGATMNEGD